MKKIILSALIALSVVAGSFAQERKPVIGLTDIGFEDGTRVPQNYKNIETQVRAAFSSAIVNSKRFAVMERSADELDKIRRENIETDGAVNPNSQLDFMLTGQIVTCERTQQTVDAVLTTVTVTKNKLAVSIKFTDVKTGQIVLSEVMTKEENGQNVTFDKLANELASELIAKVVTKLYPPMVLSVKNPGNIIQTVNADYAIGDVLEIYKNGEELLDPYTGDVIGYEEETVAFVIVFEINSKTNLVKAAVEPNGEYEKAEIVKGYGVRAKMVQKGKKEVVDNQKAKLQKFKSAGIMK